MKKNGKTYYPRLEAEIIKRGLLKGDICKRLSINRASLCYKLNGERPFTLEQAFTIQKTWFPGIPMEALFFHEKGGGQ